MAFASRVVDSGICQATASGDGTGAAHLHGEIGLTAVGAPGTGNLSLQLQASLYIQRALVDIAGQAVNKGLHQYLRAFAHLQFCVLRDNQLRSGKADITADFCAGCDPGCFIKGFSSFRLRKVVLVSEIILGDAVVGFHRGFRLCPRRGGGGRGGLGGHCGGDPHIQRAAVGEDQGYPIGDGVGFVQNARHITVNQRIFPGFVFQEHRRAAIAVGVDIGVCQQVQICALQHVDAVDEHNAGTGDVYIPISIESADAVEACHAEIHTGAFGVYLHGGSVIDHTDGASVITPAASGVLTRGPALGSVGFIGKVIAANRHDGALFFAFFGALGGGFTGALGRGFGGFLRGGFGRFLCGGFGRFLRGGFGGFLRGGFGGFLRGGFGRFLRGGLRRLLRGGFGGFLRRRFVRCVRCCLVFTGNGSVYLGSRRRLRVCALSVGGQPQRQGQGGACYQADKNSFFAFVHRDTSLE